MACYGKGDSSWFTHDRFGMFIHWGLYSMPARHEWIRNYEQISNEDYQKYLDIYVDTRQEMKYLQPYLYRLDLSDFSEHIYYEGEELNIFTESNLNPASRCALELAVFLNPASVYQFTFQYDGYEIPPYMICRDGLAAVNIACNIFWITLSSGIGVALFRKQDVAS